VTNCLLMLHGPNCIKVAIILISSRNRQTPIAQIVGDPAEPAAPPGNSRPDAESPGRSGFAVPPENSGGCGPRTSSVAKTPPNLHSCVSPGPLAKLPQTSPERTISSADSEQPGESEMLQSDSSAQTASAHHLWHAASAIPAELRARASKFNLELTASGSHLLQRSVPGLPFASLKLLRSAQPFEPGLRIHPLVTVKPQNFIRRDDPDFSLSVR
jgi:hypothetical protein